MANTAVIDELHLTISIPDDLPDTQREEIRRTLASEEFMNRLRRAVRAAARGSPELAIVRVSLTR